MSYYRSAVLKASEQAKTLMIKLCAIGNPSPLHMAYKESVPGSPGEIVFFEQGENLPFEYKATGEVLRTDVPYENYFSWVANRATRLPIL